MVIRGTPKNIDDYIFVDNDDIIYKLSKRGIFPTYIDNKQAYFKKQQLTLDVVKELYTKG